MARENFDERKIRIRVGAFEYFVEISDWLVGVNQKNKFEFPRQQTTSQPLYRITRFRRTSQMQILIGGIKLF